MKKREGTEGRGRGRGKIYIFIHGQSCVDTNLCFFPEILLVFILQSEGRFVQQLSQCLQYMRDTYTHTYTGEGPVVVGRAKYSARNLLS